MAFDEAAAEIRDLELHLMELRERRTRMQRTIAEGPLVRVATERVNRDRSDMSSPAVEELRSHVEQQHHDLAALWDGTDRTRRLAELLRRAYVGGDLTGLDAAFERELASRREAASRAADLGVVLTVPGVEDFTAAASPDSNGGR